MYTPVVFRNTELKIRVLLIFFLNFDLAISTDSAYTTSSRIMGLKYHILQRLSASQDRNRIFFLFVSNLPATFWERILFSYRRFLDNGSMILNWFTVLVSGGRNRTYFERSSCEINRLVSLFPFQPLVFLYRLLSLQQMHSDLNDFYWMYIHFMLFLVSVELIINKSLFQGILILA